MALAGLGLATSRTSKHEEGSSHPLLDTPERSLHRLHQIQFGTMVIIETGILLLVLDNMACLMVEAMLLCCIVWGYGTSSVAGLLFQSIFVFVLASSSFF